MQNDKVVQQIKGSEETAIAYGCHYLVIIIIYIVITFIITYYHYS